MDHQQQSQKQDYGFGVAEQKLPAEAYYQRPRQNNRNLAVILIIVGALWLAIELMGNGFFFGARSQSNLQRFPASSEQIVFDLGSANLVLEVEERDDIVVELVERGFWGSNTMVSEQGSRQLTIRNQASGLCFSNCDVSYRVVMPADLALEIQTDSGDIQLKGDLGPVVLNTLSGDVKIQESDDPLEVSSGSGEIVLERITADISAHSNSGDICLDTINAERAEVSSNSGEVQLKAVDAQVVQVTTSSGDISFAGSAEQLELLSSSGQIKVENEQAQSLNLETGSGDIRYRGELSGRSSIASSSGDVELKLSDPSNLRVDAKTSSGSIDSNLKLTLEENSEHVLVGSMGDGSVQLSITTSSGDVRISN